MFAFLKNLFTRLGRATINNTIVPIQRWIKNAKEGRADPIDKQTAARAIKFGLFIVLAALLPELAVLVALMRIIAISEFIFLLADICIDASNINA